MTKKKAESAPTLTAAQLSALGDSIKDALATAGRARAALTDRVDPAVMDKLQRVAREHEAAFMRDLAELRDSLDLAGEYEADTDLSREKDRGVGFRGLPEPGSHAGFTSPHEELLEGLPRNTDAAPHRNAGPSESGGAGDLAAASRPSTNPRDWAGGMASQDGSRGGLFDYEENDLGNNVTQRVWRFNDGSFVEQIITHSGGTQITVQESFNASTGRQSRAVEVYDENGLAGRTTYSAAPDGSTRGSTTVRNGATYTTYIWSKEAGSDSVEGSTEKTAGKDVKKDIATLPGTESGVDSELARAFARRFDHSRKDDPPTVTYVNPGDPDHDRPVRGTRLKPGEGIVDVHREQSRPVSREQAERWKEELLDEAGGRVNPPGPDAPPGDS